MADQYNCAAKFGVDMFANGSEQQVNYGNPSEPVVSSEATPQVFGM